MSIWAITLVLAALVVLVTRGSVVSLARVPLRALWLLFLAAVLQVGLTLVDVPESRFDDVGFGLLMLSYALLLAFCFVNLGLRGMGVVLVGVAMNTLVIGLNQGMPVADETWRDGRLVEEPVERSVKHRPESDDDLLPFLGDVIVLPPPFQETISFGDLILAIGVIDVAFWGSRRRRREAPAEQTVTVPADEPPAPDDGAEALRSAAPLAARDEPVEDPAAVIDLTGDGGRQRGPDEASTAGGRPRPEPAPPIEWEAPGSR